MKVKNRNDLAVIGLWLQQGEGVISYRTGPAGSGESDQATGPTRFIVDMSGREYQQFRQFVSRRALLDEYRAKTEKPGQRAGPIA